MVNNSPTTIEIDSPTSTSTPPANLPTVEQSSSTPPTSTSQPPDFTHFVMPGTFNDDDQITSIVDSKVQPSSSITPPPPSPQSSSSSKLPEQQTPQSVQSSHHDTDDSASLDQVSDDQDQWWRAHGDTFPEALRQLSAQRQLLGDLAASQDTVSSSASTQTRRSQRERKKTEFYGRGKGLIAYNQGKSFVAQEPLTYRAAMSSLDSDKWQEAIIAEHQSIVDAGTWEVYERKDLPSGRKAINSRWVFKVKLNADGSIERYKARLVVKGYSQLAGIDYEETFAPVTRYDSLCLVIALAVNLGLVLEQLDIKTAFLNGELKEEIWMTPPPGIGLDGKVLLLKKALYGLKQAPLTWYEKLSSVLAQMGFNPLHFDPCVFIYFNEGRKTIIVVYVDDLTIVGIRQDLDVLVNGLKTHFEVAVKGPLSWLLGFEVQQYKDTIKLSQQLYVDQLLERFEMSNLNPVSTPLDSKVN